MSGGNFALRMCAPLLLTVVAGCERERPVAEQSVATGIATAVAVGPVPGPERAMQPVRNPLGDEAVVLQEGRRLFVAFNCSGCHGGRAGGGMAPSLRDESWVYGNSDAQIFDSIASGRANGMPAWGASLPESEIWKLVAYIQSLRTAREPQAPR